MFWNQLPLHRNKRNCRSALLPDQIPWWILLLLQGLSRDPSLHILQTETCSGYCENEALHSAVGPHCCAEILEVTVLLLVQIGARVPCLPRAEVCWWAEQGHKLHQAGYQGRNLEMTIALNAFAAASEAASVRSWIWHLWSRERSGLALMWWQTLLCTSPVIWRTWVSWVQHLCKIERVGRLWHEKHTVWDHFGTHFCNFLCRITSLGQKVPRWDGTSRSLPTRKRKCRSCCFFCFFSWIALPFSSPIRQADDFELLGNWVCFGAVSPGKLQTEKMHASGACKLWPEHGDICFHSSGQSLNPPGLQCH